MTRIVCYALASLIVVALEWSGIIGWYAQAQITRTTMPVDMLNIPVNASNVPYPITARSGAGSTCTAATLNTAITAIGSTRRTLPLVPNDGAGAACTWTLEANVTTNANTFLLIEAPVSINAGFTFTINGPWESTIGPNWYSGSGTVVINHRDWSVDGITSHIVSGCAPTVPGASLTLDPFACRGNITLTSQWHHVNQVSAAVGPLSSGNGTYWLALHRDTSTAVTGWTRQTGTSYLWQQNASQPSEPGGGVIFMRVTVAGGVITAVQARGNSGPGQDASTGLVLAHRARGATFRDRILNAESQLPSTGGVIDARGLVGTYSTRGWTHTRSNVALLLGQVTIQLTCATGENGAIEIDVDDVAIVGSGPGITVIQGYCDSAIGYTGHAAKVGDDLIRTSGPPGGSGIRTSGILIRDLELDGRQASLTSCTTNDVIGHGIDDGSGTKLTVINNWVHDNPCHGIVVNGNTYSTPYSQNNLVRDNRVYSNGNAASGGYGIIVAGATNYTLVADNIVYSNRLSGILLNTGPPLLNQYNTVRGNQVHDNNVATTGYGGIAIIDVQDAVIEDNYVIGHPATGITVGTNTGTSLRNVVKGNTIIGALASSTIGIAIDASTEMIVEGNKVRSFSNRGISGSSAHDTQYTNNWIDTITGGGSGTNCAIFVGGNNSVIGGNKIRAITAAGDGICIAAGLTGVTINPNHYTTVGGLTINDLGATPSRRFDENAFGKVGSVYGSPIVWHRSNTYTLNFAAPAAVPGITTSGAQTFTSAAFGDTCIVAAPVAVPGAFYPPACYVSAASTVEIFWLQHTGAPADPDGAGGTYRVDLWRH